MNEYYQDAAYFSRRCVESLDPAMSIDAIYDSVLHFAFCVERLFKGVLWDIDPRMVLEDSKEANSFAVLHRVVLLPSVAASIDKSLKGKKPNHNTITFKEAMLKAKNFSQVTHDHIGILTQLSDYRGILAHRVLSLLDEAAARRFALRYFQPIVGQFVQEHNLSQESFFGNDEPTVAGYASSIEKEGKLVTNMEAMLETHRQAWEAHEADNEFIDKAQRLTALTLKDEKHSDYCHRLTTCPACENDATIRIETDWDVEGSRGEGWITGVYASGLGCEYCDLVLDEYEQIDYFKLNDFLNDD